MGSASQPCVHSSSKKNHHESTSLLLFPAPALLSLPHLPRPRWPAPTTTITCPPSHRPMVTPPPPSCPHRTPRASGLARLLLPLLPACAISTGQTTPPTAPRLSSTTQAQPPIHSPLPSYHTSQVMRREETELLGFRSPYWSAIWVRMCAKVGMN